MLRASHASASALLFLAAGFLLSFSANAQKLPKELRPPANERLLLQVHAAGVQIYSCKADGAQFAWTFDAPEAQLVDKKGKPFGKHFAGPTWEANDGSRVTGKAVVNVPSPDSGAIPWLLLSAATHTGEGVLARVTSIQRVKTRGGKAPASGCDAPHAGQQSRVPYSADYVFFAAK